MTLALIISIFIFSKKKANKAVSKMALPMGIFNINEPMIFGMPIVLNPLYFIPFVLVSVVGAIIAYVLTAIGVIPPVYVIVPWIMPTGLYAFFATGGSIMAALVSILNLFVAFLIWTPFVLIANKLDD